MTILILVVALWSLACAPRREMLMGPDLIVFHGAHLIDGTGAEPYRSAVVVRGEHIVRIGRADEFEYGPAVRVVDVDGRWLLPGLIDTHVHAGREALRTFLAFGVTAMRNTAAPLDAKELAIQLAEGRLLGPYLVNAGPAIHGGTGEPGSSHVFVETQDAIRAEVRRQIESGVSFVKLYRNLTLDLVAAGIEEAHEHGVPAIGHLRATDWRDAAAAGIDGLVHWMPFGAMEEFLPPEVRERIDGQERGQDWQDWCEGNLFSIWVEEVDLDGPEVAEFVEQLANSSVVVEPTLVLEEAILWGRDPSARERLRPEFAPEEYSAAEWWSFPHSYSRDCSEAGLQAGQEAFLRSLGILHQLHAAGVTVIAGSDYPNAWMTPGVALHRELELLVSAGLAEEEALSAATRNAAEALGLLEAMGTIEVGKLANMVVLGSSPLSDISNTTDIVSVVFRGSILDPERLLTAPADPDP